MPFQYIGRDSELTAKRFMHRNAVDKFIAVGKMLLPEASAKVVGHLLTLEGRAGLESRLMWNNGEDCSRKSTRGSDDVGFERRVSRQFHRSLQASLTSYSAP